MKLSRIYCFITQIFSITLFITGCTQEPKNPEGNAVEQNNEQEVVRKQKPLPPNRYNVAFLIMEGTFNTEFTAPFDIFHHTIFRDSIKAMNVFSVANTSEQITTFEGVKIVPDYNYQSDSLPNIDVLVIPAAAHNLDSDLKDTVMLNFVRSTAARAEIIMSHCDGAFILARSGLLNGRASTTFPGDLAEYKRMFPDLEVVEDVLFVHDGKFITSAGGAKSFEASLYLCETLYGKRVADELAEGMVIDWDLNKVSKKIVSNEIDSK